MDGVQITPPDLERIEAKYIIPYSLIDPISDFVSAYCTLDRYSQITPDKYYTINSLYFDTPNFLFLRKKLNKADKRFNMRIRTYGDDPDSPCFFEIKQKNINIVKKNREKADAASWPDKISALDNEKRDFHPDEAVHDLFFQAAVIYNAAPKVQTRYQRMAWVSDIDDYGRVTFDRGLMYCPQDDYSIFPDLEKMMPYDASTIFDPGCSVVLELKCYAARVPIWMLDLIRTFDLRQQAFSKYANSLLTSLDLIRHDIPDCEPIGFRIEDLAV